MADAERAFIEAEQDGVDWLVDKLDATLYDGAYPGELPEGAYNSWSFAITGPGQGEVPLSCAVSSDAELVGRFSKRKDAQLLAGTLRTKMGNALAVANPRGRVQRMRWVDEPTFSREQVRPANDQKDRLFWRVEIPLHIIFNAT